jgi:serine/threonine-protein kinase
MKHAVKVLGLGFVLAACNEGGALSSDLPNGGNANDADAAAPTGGDTQPGTASGPDGGGTAEGGASGGGGSDAGGAAESGPSATCAGGGGGGPNGGPADLFPCDSAWYRDVSAAPVSPESTGITAAIGSWGKSAFLIDFSIFFMHATPTDPRVSFTVDYADESNSTPVPIPVGGAVEGESGYACTGGGDCHLIVVDDAQKKLFEVYAANHSGASWVGAQESVWDLTKHYGPTGRGLGCTSADAAGFPVMAGLIGVRETKAGAINHALRFILPNNKIRGGVSFIPPATHGTSATSSVAGPPFGTRLRLKASFNEASIASAGGKTLVRALKKYGMYLADGGQIALTAEDDRLEKAKDPTMTWQGLLSSDSVGGITPADFEVVEYSAPKKASGCSLAPL